MLLYIIRHGLPDYSTDSLKPCGELQAREIARRLAVHGLDAVYSSPMGRARQTAQPTCDLLGLEMQIEPVFSEELAWKWFTYTRPDGHPDWGFRRKELTVGSDEAYASRDSFCHGFYGDDEAARAGYAQLCAASDDFIGRLGYRRTGPGNRYAALRPNDRRVALFCHQGLGLHLLSHLLHIPPHIFTSTFDISHTGLSIVEFSGEDSVYPVCLCLSDLSHVYAGRLPMKYHGVLDI